MRVFVCARARTTRKSSGRGEDEEQEQEGRRQSNNCGAAAGKKQPPAMDTFKRWLNKPKVQFLFSAPIFA